MKSKVIKADFGAPRIKTLKPNKKVTPSEQQVQEPFCAVQAAQAALKAQKAYAEMIGAPHYNPPSNNTTLHCPKCDCTYFKIPADLHHPAYGNPIDYIKVTCANCGLESSIQYHSPEPLKA